MRRVVMYLAVLALAVALVFVLRARKRAFVAAQVEWLQSDNVQEAEEARKRLQRVGRSAVRPVCAVLEHDDEEVRARAALTLANIGHPAAAEPLLEAAKRGDFPAADALEVMKHPRAAEARAWAYSLLAMAALAELKSCLPVGGRPPTAPRRSWSLPRQPFQPSTEEAVLWPDSTQRFYEHLGSLLHFPTAPVRRQERPLEHFPFTEALLAAAEARELSGQYAAAAELYAEALALDAENDGARERKAEAERLVALAGRMEDLLPDAYRIDRILSHPTWREGEATYYVGAATWGAVTRIWSVAPKLAVFRSEARDLRLTSTVPTFATSEIGSRWNPPTACLGVVGPADGLPAKLVALRSAIVKRTPRSRPAPKPQPTYGEIAYDAILYRLEKGVLLKDLQLPSAAMPWVGDLDEDGDAEIVTWHHISRERWPVDRLPWPIVHTLVNGQYEVRSEKFPSLFEPVADVLAERERQDQLEPKFAKYLGRAYGMLGKPELAAAAYQRAADKHEEMARRLGAKGLADQARLHREAAAEVRERCLRLERLGRSL